MHKKHFLNKNHKFCMHKKHFLNKNHKFCMHKKHFLNKNHKFCMHKKLLLNKNHKFCMHKKHFLNKNHKFCMHKKLLLNKNHKFCMHKKHFLNKNHKFCMQKKHFLNKNHKFCMHKKHFLNKNHKFCMNKKHFLNKNHKFCMHKKHFLNKNHKFPIDTPLVLRLVKTHMGKCLFSPELKSYLITQWNCTTIGSCRCRKTNQWVGSGAARTYGDDTRQYSRRNGRGIWLYKRSFRHRILRFFLLQRRRLRLRWSREAYSPLTRLAVGPSDLDLLGWSAFNAPQHRSSSGPVRCRYPAIT